MSWNKSKEDDKSSGSGLATGLMMAGGAVAAGFMLYKMFSDKPEPAPPTNHTRNTRSSSVASSAWGVNEEVASRDVDKSLARSKFENQRDVSISMGGQILSSHCRKCQRGSQEVVLEPCKHLVCENCAEEINDNCPICRRQITSIKPTYL